MHKMYIKSFLLPNKQEIKCMLVSISVICLENTKKNYDNTKEMIIGVKKKKEQKP